MVLYTEISDQTFLYIFSSRFWSIKSFKTWSELLNARVAQWSQYKRHRSHDFATHSSHSVDRAGWQAKMASIEFWIPRGPIGKVTSVFHVLIGLTSFWFQSRLWRKKFYDCKGTQRSIPFTWISKLRWPSATCRFSTGDFLITIVKETVIITSNSQKEFRKMKKKVKLVRISHWSDRDLFIYLFYFSSAPH